MTQTDTRPAHFHLNAIVNAVVGNHPVPQYPDYKAWLKVGLKQVELITEEATELLAGVEQSKAGNKATKADAYREIRDGVADVIVTLDGLVYRLGLRVPDIGSFHRNVVDAPDQLQEPQWVLNSLDSMATALSKWQTLHDEIPPGEHTVDTWQRSLTASVYNIYEAVYNIAAAWVIDLNADQVTVYESNMSKFDLDKQTALAGVQKYADLGIVVHIEEIEFSRDDMTLVYYILKSSQDQTVGGKGYPAGKFLKSINFREPQFA